MSEFNVVVVEIENFGKHPNADTLCITNVLGAYPCIFKMGDFNTGDHAVYVPVDAMVPVEDPCFAFLAGDTLMAPGSKVRVKAKKLRSIFSMGLLVHAKPEWAVGQNVQVELNIDKYEPQQDNSKTHGKNVAGPKLPWSTYDLEAYRRFPHILKEGEYVVITEKLHGANARFTYQDGQFWVGSHRCWKAKAPNIWWQVAEQYDLARLCEEHPGWMIYGEIFGWVQDLKYGAEPKQLFFRVFDIRDAMGQMYSWNEVRLFCDTVGLATVPVLWEGPWDESLLKLAEGDTTTMTPGNAHIREGIVIDANRFDEIGRVKLKHVSQAYLLRKEGDAPIMTEAMVQEPVGDFAEDESQGIEVELLDRFAETAMKVVMDNDNWLDRNDEKALTVAQVAEVAYDMAGAMIVARRAFLKESKVIRLDDSEGS